MKSRLVFPALLILAAIIALWVALKPPKPAKTSTNIPRVPPSGSKGPFIEGAVKMLAGKEETAADGGLEQLETITLAQLEPWLARTGRSAEALVAAWELTHDPALEAELVEKHSGNPLVCLALLNTSGREVNAAWVERLRKAAPDHPLPDCLDAGRAAKAKDFAGVQAALALALEKKGRRDFYQNERMVTLREAVSAAGLGERAAAYAPSKVLHGNAATYEVARGAGSLLRQVREGGIAEKEEAAAAALALATHLRTGKGDSLMSDMIVMSVYKSAADYLPADTELGETGRTLGEAVKEREALAELVRNSETIKVSNAMFQASPAEITAYFDRFMQQGEAAAMRWALERIKAAEQSGSEAR